MYSVQPERGTKRKKQGNTEEQKSKDSKKRPLPMPAGSGVSEEERIKILEMVENEPEVSEQQW